MLVDALAERPASEGNWAALRHSFDVIVEPTERDPRYGLLLLPITEQAPALRTRSLERWQEQLAAAVAARTEAGTGLNAAALTAAALASLSVANAAWLRNDGTESLRRLLDDAMTAARPDAC